MKDAQKPDHVSLTTLIGRLREGRYVIPDFQREFEWKPWDIRELLRSIFLDYYIGSLLLWKGKPENFTALACEPIYGFQGKADPSHIVLDGQQRLTAMYYAFLAPEVPAPSRQNRFLYFIRVDQFMEEAYDQAFEYDWTLRGEKLLEDRAAQFDSHMFPLAVVGQGGWALPNWVQDYEKHWQAKEKEAAQAGDGPAAEAAARHAADARAFGEHLKGITEQYQIAYIELDRDLDLDKVCDIFTQINSRGIRLDVFDLVNALLKPKGLQLKHLWREAAPRLDFVESERLNVYILQVMSILRQAYCSPKYLYFLLPGQERKVREADGSLRKEVLVPTVHDFEKRWRNAVDGLERAVNLLRHPQEFGAISSQYLPYVSILPAFATALAAARALPPNRQLDGQRKLRHWYWASVFTNRYSGSVESTTARDYLDLKAWFDSDDTEPALIAEFKTRFRTLDLAPRDKAWHVRLQRHLQPAGPARCARLDGRHGAAIRRSRRPPHRPEEQGQGAEARDFSRHDPEPHTPDRRHQSERDQRPVAERVFAGTHHRQRRGHGPRDPRVALHLAGCLRHPAPKALCRERFRGPLGRTSAHDPGSDRGPANQGAA